jgi:DNA adenine methylase
MDGQRIGDDLKPGYVILVGRVNEELDLIEVQVSGQGDAIVSSTLAMLKKDAETMVTEPNAASGAFDVANCNGTRPEVSAAKAVVAEISDTGFSSSVFNPLGKHGRRQRNSEWYTPQWLLEPLYEAMDGQPFDLDPCSPTKGAGAPVWARQHFTVEDDGLAQDWSGRCYLNPPYSNLEPWLRKAADATWCRGVLNPPTEEAGRRDHPLCEAVVALIPARTHTLYWKKFVDSHARVLFLHGKFGFRVPTSEGLVQARTTFPEGLAVVIWGNHRPFTQALLTAQLRCRGISDRSGELSDAPWEFYWRHRPHLGVNGQQGEAA